ncbi:MAG: type II secretion system protein [Phycisphaerae bacterium]|jgi:type II secretory pathway pseudopilin PulG
MKQTKWFPRVGCDKGFTLVELLVVISVIALLLGIMIPVLSAARGKAQTIVCASNLRNYGLALPMYAQDNSNKSPFMVSWLYSQATIQKGVTDRKCPKECRWHYDKDVPDGSLWPYLKNKNVNLCPTYRSYALVSKCGYSGHSKATPFNPIYSYAMNWHLGFDWVSYLGGQKVSVDGQLTSITWAYELTTKISIVNRPAQCFSFTEENPWVTGQRIGDAPKWYSHVALNDNALWLNANAGSSTFPNDATDNFATYHNVTGSRKNEGKANVAFVDGHVSTVKGLAGYDAYMEYGRPYSGHNKIRVNGTPIW